MNFNPRTHGECDRSWIGVFVKPINLEISRLLSSNFLSRKGSLLKMFPWS